MPSAYASVGGSALEPLVVSQPPSRKASSIASSLPEEDPVRDTALDVKCSSFVVLLVLLMLMCFALSVLAVYDPMLITSSKISESTAAGAAWMKEMVTEVITHFRYAFVWKSALLFVCLATVLTLSHLYVLLTHVTDRKLRTAVARILLLVPIYALSSWVGLRFLDLSIYFTTIRELYETLVLYQFFMLLVYVLGGRDRLAYLLDERPNQQHLFPFCCFKPWTSGLPFLQMTEFGVLQFVLVNLVFSALNYLVYLISLLINVPTISAGMNLGYTVIRSLSQSVAMYCLVLFYFATSKELAPCRPLPKFYSVKLLVFFTWWQGVVIGLLVEHGVITSIGDYHAEDIALALQNYLICVEMVFFSIFHRNAFPIEDIRETFRNPNSPPLSMNYVAHRSKEYYTYYGSHGLHTEVDDRLEEQRDGLCRAFCLVLDMSDVVRELYTLSEATGVGDCMTMTLQGLAVVLRAVLQAVMWLTRILCRWCCTCCRPRVKEHADHDLL